MPEVKERQMETRQTPEGYTVQVAKPDVSTAERYIVVHTLVGKQLRGETFTQPAEFEPRLVRRLLKIGAIAPADSRIGQDAEADTSLRDLGVAEEEEDW